MDSQRQRPRAPTDSRAASSAVAAARKARDLSSRDSEGWRARVHEIIFEADTRAGKAFDVALLVLIVASVVVVSLESVHSISDGNAGFLGGTWRQWFVRIEWGFTVLFTAEYVLRLISVKRSRAYALSFFGIVDLLAILPTYLMLFVAETKSLVVIRILRLLRIFRVLKLGHLVSESALLKDALIQSRGKIVVFLTTVVSLVAVLGAGMYLIEGNQDSGFTSIPQSMYWAVVTMTTVGYGDIAPVTAAGKLLAATIMLLGYSLIIVPTGILSAELSGGAQVARVSTQHCSSCGAEDHQVDAAFCKHCGVAL